MVAFATQVKRRRGTAEQNNEFTGAEGEIVVNLTDKSLRVHDGQTKGGFETLRQNMQNSVNITNSITEIPQDIKLELDNGTLTLKAGSKVYVPNGAGVFDEVVVESDLTTTSSVNTQIILFYKSDGTIGATTLASITSGTSQPAGSGYWYDTTNNIIKRVVNGAVESSGHSFPFAIVNCDTTQIISIDQTFNGFGYMGSIVFVLPGVKGLIPNGRNADGTLKNRIMTVQNVITKPIPSNTGWHYITIESGGTTFDFATNYYKGTELPSGATSYSRFYNTSENLVYSVVSGKLTQVRQFVLGCYIDHSTSSPYKINSIKQVTAFHAVDYNDTEYMAQQAMPSDKYVDLTLGATDSYYTAPADGWFFISKNMSANQYLNGYIVPGNATSRIVGVTKLSSASGAAAWTLPVSKGQRLFLTYTASGTTNYFRFIYANGAR